MSNAIIIKNYKRGDPRLSLDYLHTSDEWDLIEFNYKLDAERLSAWYKQFCINFDFMKFNFNTLSDRLNLESSIKLVKAGHCGYYCGPIDGITLAWPKERYEPLPPPLQCSPEQFPEVNYSTFNDDAKILHKFRTGYFDEMVNILGYDSFRQAIAVTHHPTMMIPQHRDSRVLKLHIPVETHPQALFHFGQNKERSHHMELGKIYLLNTGSWHGTTNDGDSKRSHIITRILKSHIPHVLALKN